MQGSVDEFCVKMNGFPRLTILADLSAAAKRGFVKIVSWLLGDMGDAQDSISCSPLCWIRNPWLRF
jgi:hypothetical protein